MTEILVIPNLGSNYIYSVGSGEENGLTIVALAKSSETDSTKTNNALIHFGVGKTKGWGVTFQPTGGAFFTPTEHNGTNLAFDPDKSPGEWSIATFRVTFEQQQEVFVDGKRVASAATDLSRLTNAEVNAHSNRQGNQGPVSLGGPSNTSFGTGLNGDIAELLVWKRAITDSERTLVEQYLAQKWGLQAQVYVPPAEQPENGLLGRWTFDEGEGDLAHDVSGNRRHGTMNNMHPVNSWVDGAKGKALEFDGVDDNVTIPNLGDEYRTIAMWLNLAQTTSEKMIAEFGEQDLKLNVTGRPIVLLKSGDRGSNIPSSLDITGVGWVHVAYRWNLVSTRYDVLVNGQSVTVDDMWGDHATLVDNEAVVFPSSSVVKLDDLRIYSRSLSDAEIKALCDQDGDGLNDAREAELGTNPNNPDTDGDGDTDLEETQSGSSPQDANQTAINAALKNGLRAYLPFDETNGTAFAADVSGNNRYATLLGFEANQTVWSPGRIGNAIRFDGVNDYATLPATLGENFTVALWVKTTDDNGSGSANQWNDQVGLVTGPVDKHALMLAGGKFRIWSGEHNRCRISSLSNVNSGAWVHLAVSRLNDGGVGTGKFKIHLNGSLDSTNNHHNTQLNTGSLLYLGRTHQSSLYFDGLMDELYLYDRALENSEVKAIYDRGLAGAAFASYGFTSDSNESNQTQAFSDALVTHLSFDENNGTGFAMDSSGNDKYATLQGFETNQTVWTPGRIGNAIRFDGVNDYATLPATLGGNFTVALWVKTTDDNGSGSANQWNDQVGLVTGPVDKHALMLAGGKFRIWSGEHNRCRISSLSNVNSGAWVHLAVSRLNDGGVGTGKFKIHLNGSLDSTNNHHNTQLNTGSLLYLGRTHVGSVYYNGLMDDLRIYDRVLTGSEVQALYDLGQ